MDSEYLMKMQMIEQEASKYDEQIQIMDQQIQEMIAIKASIEAISNTKEKEILASLGKGIFIKAEIKADNLLVNTGKDIFIKKTPQETVTIIDLQINKLEHGKEDFTNKIIELQSQMRVLMEYMQKESKHNKEHGCGDENCECDEPCEDCECKHEHKD